MNIEHCVFLSWFHERQETPAHKTMRKIAGRWSQCEVSVRRSCHGLDALDGFILPVWCGPTLFSVRTRATGTLPVITQPPECCWTNVCLA
jgi:hypothetical protein